jgi:hypothetical protein
LRSFLVVTIGRDCERTRRIGAAREVQPFDGRRFPSAFKQRFVEIPAKTLKLAA